LLVCLTSHCSVLNMVGGQKHHSMEVEAHDLY
jgi:hypothetical protein